MKKIDKRVTHSITTIKSCLIEILKDKDISRITVKEICEQAKINRSTFYAHFESSFDVLSHIETDVISSINHLLSNENLSDVMSMTVQPIEKILTYILENKDVLMVLLSTHANQAFLRQLIDIVKRENFSIPHSNTLNHPDAELVFEFLASGAINVVRQWLEDGTKLEISYISELIYKISIYGQSAFFPH